MKVLFIIPPDNDKDKFLFFKYKNLDTYVPLGIAQVSAVLEQHNHEVSCIDLRIYSKGSKNIIVDEITNNPPEIICFASYFYSIGNLFEIANTIKDKFPHIPLVMGGSNPAFYPIKILTEEDPLKFLTVNSPFSYVITSEGEITLPRLFKALEEKRTISSLPGISYKDTKGNIHRNPGTPLVKNLDSLPFPAYHVLQLQNYIPLPKHYKKLPSLALVTSRGCPWGQCNFCAQPNVKGYYRYQSPKRVINEIKYVKQKYNIKEIKFWDDNFIHSKKWILEFCRLLQHEKIDIIWSCLARVDKVDREIIRAMKKANCWQIMYGVETGDENLLVKINKNISLENVRDAVQLTKEQNIETRVSFIIGFPYETPEIAKKTIQFAKELDADVTQFSMNTPYPYTTFYNTIKDSPDLSINFNNYSEYKVVYIPKGYASKKEVDKFYRKAYRSIYLNPSYIAKQIPKISSLNDIKRYGHAIILLLGLIFRKRR